MNQCIKFVKFFTLTLLIAVALNIVVSAQAKAGTAYEWCEAYYEAINYYGLDIYGALDYAEYMYPQSEY